MFVAIFAPAAALSLYVSRELLSIVRSGKLLMIAIVVTRKSNISSSFSSLCQVSGPLPFKVYICSCVLPCVERGHSY